LLEVVHDHYEPYFSERLSKTIADTILRVARFATVIKRRVTVRNMGSNSSGEWTRYDRYWKYDKPIEKPLLDDRSYELLRLDNELQVLLVSDTTADLAGVSLDVGVGHMADPVKITTYSARKIS
jgi:hypothetical protein